MRREQLGDEPLQLFGGTQASSSTRAATRASPVGPGEARSSSSPDVGLDAPRQAVPMGVRAGATIAALGTSTPSGVGVEEFLATYLNLNPVSTTVTNVRPVT
ncbi:hypothetical protein C6I20_13720 [Aeromicrobium sp. A1-2]|nr:hypothetical protein C6I20_13720 [Aeromicrobium sp. A1-2]